jgi:hypothetical protein
METIHTIKTDDLTAKLNKSEIDIIQFIDSWLPTFDSWSILELSERCQISKADTIEAVDMLVLHGLIEHSEYCELMGPTVQVTIGGALWIRENTETINCLRMMLDTNLFSEAETAIA